MRRLIRWLNGDGCEVLNRVRCFGKKDRIEVWWVESVCF